MRTSLTWAVAGTAIASGAMLTLAGAAGAATVTKTPTTLTISESTAHTAPGQQELISGVLLSGTTPQVKRIVDLYSYDAMSMTWTLLGTGRTDTTGKITFAVRPTSTTQYRLEFHGNMVLAASHSGVARDLVAKLPTTLSAAASTPTITAGQRETISGVLLTGKSPLNRRVVVLYRFDAMSGMWVQAASTHTLKTGKATFAVTPMATAMYELGFYGSPTLDASHSGSVTVTVTP